MTTYFDPSLYNRKVPERRRAVAVPKEPVEVKSSRPIEVRDSVPVAVLEPVEALVLEAKSTTFDPKLYEKVLAQAEGMRHRVYRKALARYVSTLSGFERVAVLKQREEIEASEEEWKELNFEVLRRLGFGEGEAAMLRDKRLDSPGMRTLIRKRAEEVKKRLKAETVLRRVG